MSKTDKYNKELRSSILICSIRTEAVASSVLKNMLRIVKGDTKTLGNKSSNLSFKNKIDLLYDIEDLTQEEYTLCLKFMELRNQFIHNPNCNTFTDLEKEAPEIISFLKKNVANKIAGNEESYIESFRQIWIRVFAKLLTLNIEYSKGAYDEMMKFVNTKAVNNLDNILKSALEKWRESKPRESSSPLAAFGLNFDNTENEISKFEHYVKIAFVDEQIKILDSITNKEFTEKDVYRRKTSLFEEIKNEIEKEEAKTKQDLSNSGD